MEFSQNIGFLFNSVLKVGKFVKTSVHIEKGLLNLFRTLLGDVDRKQRQKQFLKKDVIFLSMPTGTLIIFIFFLKMNRK
jgi:hypothetical protein